MHKPIKPRKDRDLWPFQEQSYSSPAQRDRIESNREERGYFRLCPMSSRWDASSLAHGSLERSEDKGSPAVSGESLATKDKYFKCSYCGEGFKFMYDLKVHSRVHAFQQLAAGQDGDFPVCRKQPLTCSECGKPFIRASHLYSHMRTHTGEKHYKCDTCGKRFDYESILKLHVTYNASNPDHECVGGKDNMPLPNSPVDETQELSDNPLVSNGKGNLFTFYCDETPAPSEKTKYWGSADHESFRESRRPLGRCEEPVAFTVSPETVNGNPRFLCIAEASKSQQRVISQEVKEKTNRKRKEFLFRILVENQIEKEALKETIVRLQNRVNKLKHSIRGQNITNGKHKENGKIRRKQSGDVTLEDNFMKIARPRVENNLKQDDATPRERCKQNEALKDESVSPSQSYAINRAGHCTIKRRKSRDMFLLVLKREDETQTRNNKSLVTRKLKGETPMETHKSPLGRKRKNEEQLENKVLVARKRKGEILTGKDKLLLARKCKGEANTKDSMPVFVWKRQGQAQSQTENKFLSTRKRKRETVIETQGLKRRRVHFHLRSTRVFSDPNPASKHECIKCGRTFRHESILSLHMEVHLDGKKYDCNFCGERFNSSVILRRHRGKHTREEERQHRITKFARIGSPPSLTMNTSQEIQRLNNDVKAGQQILTTADRKCAQRREASEDQAKFPCKGNLDKFVNKNNPSPKKQSKRVLKINFITK